MKKFNYKVLEINNVIEPIEGKFNCTFSSYTKDCIIENQFTVMVAMSSAPACEAVNHHLRIYV